MALGYNLLGSAKTLILLSLLISDLAFANKPDNTIILGVTAPALKSSQVQLAKRISSEILEELNYRLEIEILPSIRLAKHTKMGATDGELIRMSRYGELHPYLTRVDEPIFEFTIAIYSHDNQSSLANWADLKSLNVGYRRGVKIIENELVNVLKESNVKQFTDIPRALRMLSMKRLDAYVGVETLTNEHLMRQSDEIKSSIFKISNPKKDSAHIFLSKEFSFLAPKISAALKKMKHSGRYNEIKQQIKKDSLLSQSQND